MTKEQLLMEGDALPPYRLYYALADGSAGECVASFQSLDEVKTFRRRLDKRYILLHRQRKVDFLK